MLQTVRPPGTERSNHNPPHIQICFKTTQHTCPTNTERTRAPVSKTPPVTLTCYRKLCSDAAYTTPGCCSGNARLFAIPCISLPATERSTSARMPPTPKDARSSFYRPNRSRRGDGAKHERFQQGKSRGRVRKGKISHLSEDAGVNFVLLEVFQGLGSGSSLPLQKAVVSFSAFHAVFVAGTAVRFSCRVEEMDQLHPYWLMITTKLLEYYRCSGCFRCTGGGGDTAMFVAKADKLGKRTRAISNGCTAIVGCRSLVNISSSAGWGGVHVATNLLRWLGDKLDGVHGACCPGHQP